MDNLEDLSASGKEWRDFDGKIRDGMRWKLLTIVIHAERQLERRRMTAIEANKRHNREDDHDIRIYDNDDTGESGAINTQTTVGGDELGEIESHKTARLREIQRAFHRGFNLTNSSDSVLIWL